MAKKKKPKGPKTLEEKVKDVDEYFVEETRLSTSDQIKERLVKLDRYEDELLAIRDEDEDLKIKRDAARIAGETYSIPLKAIKLKRAFSLKVLSEKGGK